MQIFSSPPDPDDWYWHPDAPICDALSRYDSATQDWIVCDKPATQFFIYPYSSTKQKIAYRCEQHATKEHVGRKAIEITKEEAEIFEILES